MSVSQQIETPQIAAGQVVKITNANGVSPVLLVCEHASAFIPDEYNGLGLTDAAKTSHAAWDPGALAVATHLSEILDATLISQKISRLVYDCNRPPNSPTAIPPKSEIHEIPGNTALSIQARDNRVAQVYTPFKTALSDMIAERDPIIVTIHSFTPVYNGTKRDVEIGILHDTDSRLADKMLMADLTPYNVQRNQPYGPQDGVTHTLTTHALPRGLQNVMIEIRNDLIGSPTQQADMAHWLARVLRSDTGIE